MLDARPLLQRAERFLKWAFYFVFGAVTLITAATYTHVWFSVCPLHLRIVHQDDLVPVIYGLPTEESVNRASKGEVVLGGCIVGPIAAICPYCSLPARFGRMNEPSAVALDDRVMSGLSVAECRIIRAYATNLVAGMPSDYDERITSAVVTPTDVWIGTFMSGLHRYDRAAMKWKVMGGGSNGVAGRSVNAIRQKGSRIFVEHDTAENGWLFYLDYSDDRGVTWKRD